MFAFSIERVYYLKREEDETMVKVFKKIRCEDCGSTLIYFRVTTNERVCRSCGHVQKLKKNKTLLAIPTTE